MDRERKKKTGMNLNGMSQIYDYYDENKSSMKWNEWTKKTEEIIWNNSIVNENIYGSTRKQKQKKNLKLGFYLERFPFDLQCHYNHHCALSNSKNGNIF